MNFFKLAWDEMVSDIKGFFSSPRAFFMQLPLGKKIYVITDTLANIGFILTILGIIFSRLEVYPLSFQFLGIGILFMLLGFVGGLGELLRGGARYAAFSVIAWGLILSVPIITMASGWQAPRIHDISTDLRNPPGFVAVVPLRAENANSLARKEKGLSKAQRKAYPQVRTLRLRGKSTHPAKVFEAARDLAHARGWEVVATNPKKRTIEAVASSFFMGFKDDVVIRIGTKRNKRSTSVLVDMRSVSRFGVSDLGKNAARIEGFLAELKQKVRATRKAKRKK